MAKDIDLRAQQYFFGENKDVPMCANCGHFYMHYIRKGTGYVCIHSGHCTTPRMKTRDAWDLCQFFTPIGASRPRPGKKK